MSAPSALAVSGRWQAGALQAALDDVRVGVSLELRAEVDSTSTHLLARARGGDTQTVLLVAERQTAGRGRMGRAWWSDTAARSDTSDTRGPSSLSFSLGMALAPKAWSGLSLAVGVALAEALDPSGPTRGPRVRLKWPNDLWLGDDGRKFGGVLIETIAQPAATPQARYAVVGVGLNLDAPPASADIDTPTAGWREVEPQADAYSLLARVAPALSKALAEFEVDGFAAFASRYAQRDALIGRQVSASATPPLTGRADGVDAAGALRLVTDAGLRLIDSAEVSVRPC
jgi:BirA family transcriptional regulator, biotin operon repressor / biotin---[acetyl-CoA-carboxylase] ligase